MTTPITVTDFIGKEPVGQHSAHHAISRFARVQGKKVLEIGGNSDCVAARHFIEGGASQVVVSGLYHVDEMKDTGDSRITLERADALHLADLYPAESFDFLYGISVFEHIPNPEKFLSQVWHVLAKGGIAFIQGSPLWSGPWGHHIWLNPWTDNTTRSYQFLPSPALLQRGVNVINPIPDWGHLLYKKEELADHLTQNDIPDSDVQRIVSFVYEEDAINREPASAIYKAMQRSRFLTAELEFDRIVMNKDLRDRLRNKLSEDEDYSIMGVRAVLIKN